MDQIVNFILQDSDQEVEMGSDDDENSDSDWEYEEEEDPKNDKTEDSAVISSTPHAKSPLSDGNRINDDVPASQNVDIQSLHLLIHLFQLLDILLVILKVMFIHSNKGSQATVPLFFNSNANNTNKSGANNSDASSDVSSRGDKDSGVRGRVAVRRRGVRTRGGTRGSTQGVGRPACGRGVGLGRSLSHGRSCGRRCGRGRGRQPIVRRQAAQAFQMSTHGRKST